MNFPQIEDRNSLTNVKITKKKPSMKITKTKFNLILSNLKHVWRIKHINTFSSEIKVTQKVICISLTKLENKI